MKNKQQNVKGNMELGKRKWECQGKRRAKCNEFESADKMLSFSSYAKILNRFVSDHPLYGCSVERGDKE